MNLLMACMLVGGVLLAIEVCARRFRIPQELSRKASHILTGAVSASFAFWLSYAEIIIAAIIFCLIMIVAYRWHIFTSIHSKNRSSIGEVLFPAGIALVALFHPSPAGYAFAILVLAFSDGLAGLIGYYFGKAIRIPLIHTKKSVIGSATFFTVTLLIGLCFGISIGSALIVAVALTIVELACSKGFDNLVLPAFGALLYASLVL